MIRFIGEYSGKMDDKGRMVLPSAFKSLMSADEMSLVVRKDIFSDCLELFTLQEWSRRSDELKARLNFLNEEHKAFWRKFMRSQSMLEVDPKTGRITVPRKMLESIGVIKEVIFAGADHTIEIWAKEKFEGGCISDEAFIAIADRLAKL